LPSAPGIQGFIKLNQMGAAWSEVRPQLINLLLLVVTAGCRNQPGVFSLCASS
jgi:hypothetical protein